MAKKEPNKEMSLEQAKEYRASLHITPVKVLTEKERREAFRLFWATEKAKYGKPKKLEAILWMHLKSSHMDEPAKFASGLAHFGLKKVK